MQFARKRERHSSRISGLNQFKCPKEGRRGGRETRFFGVAWRVRWASKTGVEWEKSYVANFSGICFSEEGRVVGLRALGNGNGGAYRHDVGDARYAAVLAAGRQDRMEPAKF